MLSLMHHLRHIECVAARVLQSRNIAGDDRLDTESEEGSLTEDDEEDERQKQFSMWIENALKSDKIQFKTWSGIFNTQQAFPDRRNIGNKIKTSQALNTSHIFQRVNVDYKTVYDEQKKLESQWRDKSSNNMIEIEERLTGFKTFSVRRELKGISFLKESIESGADLHEKANPFASIIQGDGGFVLKYSHTIPALFLRDAFIRSNSHIDFHVLCHGFNWEGDVFEWGWSYPNTGQEYGIDGIDTDNFESLARLLLESRALTLIRANKIKTNLRRICIWMQFHSHVAVLCWDEFREPTLFTHFFTVFCNMGGETIDVNAFRNGLEKVLKEKGILNRDEDMQFQIEYIEQGFFRTKIDFGCVSVMARSGLVLSWFEGFNFNVVLNKKLKDMKTTTLAFHYMRDKYVLFEKQLFSFISEKSNHGSLILFPPSLNASFVNSLDISLVAMNMESNCEEYVYFGDTHGFQKKDFTPPKPEARCVIS